MARRTGTYVTSTTLGQTVRAFVPAPLPPLRPALDPAAYAEANRTAEMALARLAGVAGLPICTRLLCDAHRVLMDGARGAGKQPGELRRSQNWIGGSRPGNAVFVPPPPDRVPALLADLERFIQDPAPGLPPPVREAGDWEAWTGFFLQSVTAAAAEAERNIIAIASLVAADRRRLLASPRATPASYRLFEQLPMLPRFTIARVTELLGTSVPTATAAVRLLQELGLLTELTGQRKNRSYSYQAYVALLAG